MKVVTLKIREIAQNRGIKTAYQLQKITGAQPTVAAKWYRNEIKSISFDTLNLLCNALGCTPNELLAYEPDKPE